MKLTQADINVITGSFKPGSDGTFYGFIDVLENRINCRLIPEKGSFRLETFIYPVPEGRSGSFVVMIAEKTDE
jgi:hypothetical protein